MYLQEQSKKIIINKKSVCLVKISNIAEKIRKNNANQMSSRAHVNVWHVYD